LAEWGADNVFNKVMEGRMNNKIYPSVKNAILLSLLFLGIQIGLGFVIGFIGALLKADDVTNFTGIITAFGNIAAFGIVLLIGFKKTKRTFNDVFKFNKVSPQLWVATTVFMIGLIVVSSELDNILNFVLPMPEIFRNIFDDLMAKQALVFAIIVVGIIPTISEEMFFRGLVLDGLSRNYSKKKAIIVSSLLFGIVHLNPWQFLSAFIIGLFSAWICLNTHSILLSMYIHLFNNVLSTLIVRFKEFIPIKGFNTNSAASVEFQPLWFDLLGLAVFALGIMLLRRNMKKKVMPAQP
jgi:membrane protease YdiL (CAAX protease family)